MLKKHFLTTTPFIIFLLIVIMFGSCKKENLAEQEYSFQRIEVNDSIRKIISLFKKDMQILRAEEVRNISIAFSQTKDTIFAEVGAYKPNFKMVKIEGVDVVNKDTIYLFNWKGVKDLKLYYKPVKGKVIVKEDTYDLAYYDPPF